MGHRLCGHPVHLLICLGWFFFCQLASRSAGATGLHSSPIPGPDSSCNLAGSQGEGLLGRHWSGSQGPVFLCRQPSRHHPACFSGADKCPSPLIPLLHSAQKEICLLSSRRHALASCGLISSNGGGDCPWTASRNCPLLASSRIGGRLWGPRSCGFYSVYHCFPERS